MAPKSIEARYQKLTQIEHVLKRPDTYVGSLALESSQQWVWCSVTDRMVYKTISYSPGLFKIFDEILVNAADVKARQENEGRRVTAKITTIKIDIDQDHGTIKVWNDGDGIPVEIHREHKMYVPELIFGHLLTSDNYDDDEARVTGGRNGYGAKLTNILSKRFIVECGDSTRGRHLKVVWENNMGKKTDAVIKDYTKKDFVSVTFQPDFKLFGIEGFTDDVVALFKKRVYDIAGTTGVKVALNGRDIGIRKFVDYCNLYFPPPPNASVEPLRASVETDTDTNDDDLYMDGTESRRKQKKSSNSPSSRDEQSYVDPDTGLSIVKIHERVGRWEIVIAQSETGTPQQVSFVNNICTIKGGSHVKYVTDQLLEPIMKKVNTKNKGGMSVTNNMALSHIWVFVNCLLVNPVFEGQTKERLKSDPKNFGSVYKISDKVIKGVLNSPILEAILLWVQTKQAVDVHRKMNASNRKSTRITGIPKLEDANEAGGKNARKCTLIITEGDSAKTSCVAGLSVVGRDHYGVFPLRGKLLNVREAKHEALVNNMEIKNVMEILGLRMGAKNQTVDELRYGKLMIMTDQDPDGSHIKGLIINLMQVFWPDLIKSNRFLCEFVTPIVKCTKGSSKVAFFTNTEYRQWKRLNNDGRGWKIKYYKGLGTSTDNEFKEYFSKLELHTCRFQYIDEIDFKEVDKAFNSKLADDRKLWIGQSNIDTDWVDHSQRSVTYRDFINKDLVHFSRYDVERSIASVVDGCKPGMRKCIYASIKKKIFKNEIRITQLCGHVLEVSAYHHGEAALQETIIKLAQRFVGANNIALFDPVGQFGSRKEGGKDCSAPRYINTRLSHLSRSVLPEADEAILDIQMEDGQVIEPTYYAPVIPLVLVNGTEGIGTGWSSSVPQYNPRDLIACIRKWIKGDYMDPLTPWFAGFKGDVRPRDRGFESVGKFHVRKEPTTEEPWAIIVITELPVKFWTQAFKDLLESMMLENQTDMPSNNAIEANLAPRAKGKTKSKSKAKAKGKAKSKPISGVVRQRSKEIVIQDYRDNSSHVDVLFEVVLDKANYDRACELGIAKEFKLIRPIATTNMVLFDRTGAIKKYETELDIVRDFCEVRLEYYVRRKKYILAKLERELAILTNKSNFIKAVCDLEIVVSRKKKAVLTEELNRLGYQTMSAIEAIFKTRMREINANNARKEDELIHSLEEDAEPVEDIGAGLMTTDYDYLLSMPIHSLTLERYENLMSDVRRKDDDLETCRNTSEAQLWDTDLTKVEEALVWQEEADAKAMKEMQKFAPKRTSIKLSSHHAKRIRATPLKSVTSKTTASKAAPSTKKLSTPKKKPKTIDEDEESSEIDFDESSEVSDSLKSISGGGSPVRAQMKPKPDKQPAVKKHARPDTPPETITVNTSPKKVLSLADRLAQRRAERASSAVPTASFNIDDVFAKLDDSSPGTGGADDFIEREMSLLNATKAGMKRSNNGIDPPAKRQQTAPKSVQNLDWVVSDEEELDDGLFDDEDSDF